MKEIIIEVFSSIKQHKVRSILTGFGIAWAMFILIVLLGAGNGFRSGMFNLFRGYASNSMWVTGLTVKEATLDGLPLNSQVSFDQNIIDKISRRFTEIIFISPEMPVSGNYIVSFQDNRGMFDIKGIGREYLDIKSLEIGKGREFNRLDFKLNRRNVILGNRVKEILFDEEDPIGKYINVSGVHFQVIGLVESGTMMNITEQNSIYAPETVIRNIFNPEGKFYTFGILLTNETALESFEGKLRRYIANIVGFSENDNQALFVNNMQLQFWAFNSLFNGINVILWVLGLCILLTGMIGISNIMLVVVKERTQEIGIRKAIGATPRSIIVLILSESIIITMLFGVIGLLLGYGGMSLYNLIIGSLQQTEEQIFARATVDGYVILISCIIMIISGTLAGLYPARKAAKIMPIETLNSAHVN